MLTRVGVGVEVEAHNPTPSPLGPGLEALSLHEARRELDCDSGTYAWGNGMQLHRDKLDGLKKVD